MVLIGTPPSGEHNGLLVNAVRKKGCQLIAGDTTPASTAAPAVSADVSAKKGVLLCTASVEFQCAASVSTLLST